MPNSALRWAPAARRFLAALVPVFFCATAFAQSPQTPARPPVHAAPENFSLPSSSITVPEVVRMPYAKARAALEGVHLVPVLAPASRVDLATAEVAAQQPSAGTRVGPGTRIILTLGAPRPSEVTLPNLIGLPRAEAEAMLRQLRLGWRLQDDRSAGAGSRVAAQQPGAGTQLPVGSVIVLSLTQPPVATIPVPDLVGHTLAEAESLLRPLALAASVRNPQAAYPTAKITAQAPQAGTKLEPHATIHVTVEAIPTKVPNRAMTTVPSIVDRKLADARRAATDAQLHLMLPNERPAPADDVMVVGQDPPAGRRVPVESSVRATLAPPLATVPPLVGRTVRDARDLLGAVKLTPALPTDAHWPEDARITRQQPVAGTKVALGSKVEILTTPPTIDPSAAQQSSAASQPAPPRPLADAAPAGPPSVAPLSATSDTTTQGDEASRQPPSATTGTTPTHRPGPDSELAKMRELREQIEALPKGNIVLTGPAKMTVGDVQTVSARVGVAVLMEKLRLPPRAGNQAAEAELHVSSEMAATLVASSGGFEIIPKTPERQSVAEGLPTEWLWQVQAKKDGEQELLATLYALVRVGDTEQRERVESYTHKIAVAVRPQTWGEWLGAMSQEVDAVKGIVLGLGATATAVLGWFGWMAHRNKKAKGVPFAKTKRKRAA